MYNEGISTTGDIIDLGVDQEIIDKRGAFFSYGDTRLGQGRENSKAFLRGEPELMTELDGLIREKFGLPINLVPKSEVAAAKKEAEASADVDAEDAVASAELPEGDKAETPKKKRASKAKSKAANTKEEESSEELKAAA